ncbi:MAG TPA: autotransporter domain-containing protein, partial [Xanthobacteraceae bacterium]|nr:autotransporter domain-containing protein [Xanthobacteraceae bacterium]
MLFATACAGHAQAPPNGRQIFPIGENDAAASNSANYTLFGLGTRYLQLLGNQGGPSWQANQFGTGPNPGGGGAPAAPEPPRYRVWTELYALTSNSGAQPFFPGDARRTYGGVAGFSMNVASNATVGISVDDSKTRIDITSLPQHATLYLTQVGVNGAYEW